MKTPIELLFKGEVIAEISKFGYATPWASAFCNFKNQEFGKKLAAVTIMEMYSLELEELGLSDSEEELMWNKKLSELSITSEDLGINRDKFWSVRCDDHSIDPVRAIRYDNDGFLEWRP